MRSPRDLRTYYPAILVLISLLLFTIFSFYQVRKSTGMRRARLFDFYKKQTSEKLQNRINDYAQILRGCQGLFYSSDSLTSREWERYISNLQLDKHYPGVQGLGFAKYIRRSQISDVEKLIRPAFPYFKVHSLAESDFLTPILFIEPKDKRNLRAFGFDMFSEDNRRQAMTRAMLSGDPALTKKIKLVQETTVDVQPGFILYLPIYRKPQNVKTKEDRRRSIFGFVHIPFRAYDLMEAVFNQQENIQIELYDQDKLTEENLLFRSANLSNAERAKSELRTDTIIHVAGSIWTMRISTQEEFGSPAERSQPQLILILGTAISVLMYFLTINYINKRQLALEELDLAKEIERKKDEFIGIASHELKTPLTSIKAYLQMLSRANLNEKEQHFVQKANTQTTKLNSLIADLLDVSKIQAGSLKLNEAPYKLNDLINESIESVLHMYQSHKIISPDQLPDITLTGDKIRLEQALINLLVNAIKYSPGAGSVKLTLSIQSSQVIICVHDQGIGISKENQKRVFEKFYRAEELSPVFSGLGMGLFITYEIIRRHKGNIKVESQLGKGSTFKIFLPIS